MTHELLWDFDVHTDHLISGRRPDDKKIKKSICKIVDFADPADHRIKLKECEKKGKYLDLARELKSLWNMKVTIVPIVIGAFGTVTKGLLKRLEDLEVDGRVETIQMTALLRTARILRRVLETWGDLLSLKPQWKTITYGSICSIYGTITGITIPVQNGIVSNVNEEELHIAKIPRQEPHR